MLRSLDSEVVVDGYSYVFLSSFAFLGVGIGVMTGNEVCLVRSLTSRSMIHMRGWEVLIIRYLLFMFVKRQHHAGETKGARQ